MKSKQQNSRSVNRTFRLAPDGAISVFASEPDAGAVVGTGDLFFDSQAVLQRVTAEWSSSRLVDLWNRIPGIVPIEKFKDRPTALKRIWDAIQSLEPAPPIKPEAATAVVTRTSGGARSGTKKAALLALLARDEGASLLEMMTALGWQSHSVRGCLSSLSRKGLPIHSFRRSDGERAYSTIPSGRTRQGGGTIVARVGAAWSIKKGGAAWKVTEQIRISPLPKLGGWTGRQLRLLSVSRGQSIITDLELGSLAVDRRSVGLPSMQRMWFQGQGYSLGYTKPRGSPEPPQLFFLGPDANLWAHQRLPALAIDATAGNDQWFVACRDGRVHAFALDGTPLWSELIPCERRDNSTNEYWGLPVFHPRLLLDANSGLLVIGAEQQFHRYDPSGKRIWSAILPVVQTAGPRTVAIDFPTREHRLSRLGL